MLKLFVGFLRQEPEIRPDGGPLTTSMWTASLEEGLEKVRALYPIDPDNFEEVEGPIWT